MMIIMINNNDNNNNNNNVAEAWLGLFLPQQEGRLVLGRGDDNKNTCVYIYIYTYIRKVRCLRVFQTVRPFVGLSSLVVERHDGNRWVEACVYSI